MAEFLNVSYAEVALAALVPALLYYFCLFLQADLLAARTGIAAVDRRDIPRIGRVMGQGGQFLLPFAVLIGTLFFLGYEAERAVATAMVVTLVLWAIRGYKTGRLALRPLVAAIEDAGESVADIIVIGATAGILIGVLNITAVSFGITLQLVHIGEGNLFVLLVIAAVLSIILGLGLPTIGVYLLLVTLLAPSLTQLGVSAMSAHMFIFFYGMLSMITPPIAVAAFAAANIGGAPAMATGWAAMRFAWPAFALPFTFVYSPTLLLEGTAGAVALSVVTATLGVAAVTSAIVGYAADRLAVWQRLALGIGGAVLLVPPDAIPRGLEWNGAGLVVALAGLAGSRFARRRPAAEAAPPAIPEEHA